MSFMFNLDNYDPVEKRLGYRKDAKSFWEDFPDGRIATELEVCDKDRYVVKAYLYKTYDSSIAWVTGLAEEKVSDRGVNATSALENCETSAIGRALANAGYAAKGKRASREEMSKVVASKPSKPSVVELDAAIRAADKEPAEQDYWTTPVNEYMKVVDAPVTLDKALETVASIMGTGEASEVPQCKHGSMVWKTGHSTKTGKDWQAYQCTALGHSGFEGKCPAIWYVLGSDGKFVPQKPRG
jgi:hypothetical protein